MAQTENAFMDDSHVKINELYGFNLKHFICNQFNIIILNISIYVTKQLFIKLC